jgi:hypothetical protein
MRLISFSVALSLALLSSAVLAQPQTPGTTGETIGHPPPIPGPPPLPGPPPVTQQGTPANAAPAAKPSEPSAKGYTGAFAPASDNAPPPYYKGPLPEAATGPGLNVVAADGISTKTVKAVPCSIAARSTDGTTTCVGIPDPGARRRRR